MEEKINTGSQEYRDEPALMVSELKAIKDFCKGAPDAIAVVDRSAVVAGKRAPDGANTSRSMLLRFTSAFNAISGWYRNGPHWDSANGWTSAFEIHFPACVEDDDIKLIRELCEMKEWSLARITFNTPVFIGIDFIPRKKIECAVIVREKDRAIMLQPIGDQVEEALLSAMQDIRDDLIASDIVAYTGI